MFLIPFCVVFFQCEDNSNSNEKKKNANENILFEVKEVHECMILSSKRYGFKCEVLQTVQAV